MSLWDRNGPSPVPSWSATSVFMNAVTPFAMPIRSITFTEIRTFG